jgi:hypothetical protein
VNNNGALRQLDGAAVNTGNIIVKKSVSGSVNTVSGDIKIANNV